jgi:GAF domain-containing protein
MSTDQNQVMELARLARALGAAERGEQDRMVLAVQAAVDLVPGCVYAGITVNRQGECLTLAGSSETLEAINALQNELGQGPCHPADREDEIVVGVDLSRDDQWPVWSNRIHSELGVSSLISLLIYTARDSYGTLSLYSDRPHAFDGEDLDTARALAGHLAVALAADREFEGLGLALSSRTVIGQAEGIVMERLQVDADQALAYLKRVSSHTNTKLVQVALDLVRTRQLPEA